MTRVMEDQTSVALENALRDLALGTATKRKRAVRTIRKIRSASACDGLAKGLEQEMQDRRRWEAQVSLISALGECGCGQQRVSIESILERLDLYPVVRGAAAYAVVLLQWTSAPDRELVMRFLRQGDECIATGVLEALATGVFYAEEWQADVINTVEAYPEPPRGYRRVPLTELARLACQWSSTAAHLFVERCLASSDLAVRRTAELSGGRRRKGPPRVP